MKHLEVDSDDAAEICVIFTNIYHLSKCNKYSKAIKGKRPLRKAEEDDVFGCVLSFIVFYSCIMTLYISSTYSTPWLTLIMKRRFLLMRRHTRMHL